MITRTCAQGLGEPRGPTGAAAPLVPPGCTSLDAPAREKKFCILKIALKIVTGEYQSPPLPSPGDLERARSREER